MPASWLGTPSPPPPHFIPGDGLGSSCRVSDFRPTKPTFSTMFWFLSHQPLNQINRYFNGLWSCLCLIRWCYLYLHSSLCSEVVSRFIRTSKRGGYENFMRISLPDGLEPEKMCSPSLDDLLLIRGLFFSRRLGSIWGRYSSRPRKGGTYIWKPLRGIWESSSLAL